jgi:hypothetical protein
MREHEDDHVEVADTRKMSDALDTLTGHCPHLTFLRLAFLGPHEPPAPDSQVVQLYQSYARFIASVRGTLRTLSVEQGYCENEQGNLEAAWDPDPVCFPRPMDELFVRHILPVLEEAPWPCMEKLVLEGVGKACQEFDRKIAPTEKELDAGDKKYENILFETFGDGGRGCYSGTMTAVAIPSAEDMQARLQKLMPQARILVREDQSQDYESFKEEDSGVLDKSMFRDNGALVYRYIGNRIVAERA